MSFSASAAIGEFPGIAGEDHYIEGGGAVPPDAQRILDTLSAHIAVLDQSGQIVAVNQAWRQFAADNDGLLERTGVGTNYLEICEKARGDYSDEARAVLTGLKSVLEGRIPHFRLEYPCHSPTEARWFLIHASPLRGPAGGIVTAHLVITERKLAEIAARQAADRLASSNEELVRLIAERDEIARSRHQAYLELEAAYQELKAAQSQLVQAEKLSALGQIVAGVAHEINNPLAFVTNNLALLRRETHALTEVVALYESAHPLLTDHHPELITHINEVRSQLGLGLTCEDLDELMERTAYGLKRIHHIVTSLRNFARLDEALLKEADINDGVRSTIGILSMKARERGVRLELDLAALPQLCCYPGQINQVVLNLVANAIDACAEGATVIIRTVEAEGGVEIHVIDEGEGIDPSIQNRIFDPFFTTKPVGQGTGLGLSIGYRIVDSHGGRIRVESAPGKGSHFTVWLPLESRPPHAQP